MRLMHNMFSLNIYKNYKDALADNSKTIQNISSGIKLNSAKDNPNKIAEAGKLKIQILSRQAASDNVQDTNSMIQTFDGALQETNNNISRLKQLVVQASTGTNSDEDLAVIQKEIEGIKSSINDLANNTSFNGVKLSQSGTSTVSADGTTATKVSVTGEMGDEAIKIPFYDVTTGSDGLNIDDIDVTKAGTDTGEYLDRINSAVTNVTSIRSKYGSIQNSLEDSLKNFDEVNGDLSSAQSSIEDTDIATEMMKNATSQVLIKSSVSLLQQSNRLPQDCLNILANVR